MRKLQKEFSKVSAKVTSSATQVAATLLDFGDTSEFNRELSVVTSRNTALKLVNVFDTGGTAPLNEYLRNFSTDADGNTLYESDGPDSQPVATAAPCFGFENLLTLHDLGHLHNMPVTITSVKLANEWEAQQMVHFRATDELCKSVARDVRLVKLRN